MGYFHKLIKPTNSRLKLAVLLLLVASFCIKHQAILAADLIKPSALPQTAKVLSPEKFVGKVSLGYKAAQTIPEICSNLFCYCGCDLTDNHTSLLDCFTCEHGMDCDVCLDEAILAMNKKEQGKSLSDIQKSVEQDFASLYPWDKPSAALIKYRTTHKIGHTDGSTESGATATKKNKKSQSGKCCGHK